MTIFVHTIDEAAHLRPLTPALPGRTMTDSQAPQECRVTHSPPITGKVVMMNRLARAIVRTGSVAALAVAFGTGASADAVEDFYHSKTLTLICYSTAGSTYDLYSRMLA